jgi:hypothetical protein
MEADVVYVCRVFLNLTACRLLDPSASDHIRLFPHPAWSKLDSLPLMLQLLQTLNLYHPAPDPAMRRPLSHIVLIVVLSPISLDGLSERDVDTAADVAFAFRYGVLPACLSLAAHDDHVAVVQYEFLRGEGERFVGFMAEMEIPRGAEGERGNAGLRAEKVLRVRMERDRV